MFRKSLAGVAVLVSAMGSANAAPTQYEQLVSYLAVGLGPRSIGVAPQQSLLSLYGTLDIGFNYTRSGSKGVARLESGGAYTSKFGIYGQEALGAGWTAFFRIENGFLSDSGSLQDSSTLFNRASYIGLHHRQFGQLMLGRQYTSLGAAALYADPFLATAHESVYSYLGGVADLGMGASGDALARLNKTIRYASPRFGPFAGDVSYSFKSDQTVGPAVLARTAMGSYYGDRFAATMAFGQSWCDPSVKGSCNGNAIEAASQRTDTYLASAMYDFGPLIGQAAYIRIVPKHDGSDISNLYLLGLQKIWRNNLLRMSLGYRRTSRDGNYSYGSTVGIDHFLSKRTAFYGRAGLMRNGPEASLTYNYDSGAFIGAPGRTVTSVTVGITHHF
ncbi:porin [Cupriavidus plantarum]|uniref:porin n=1 Tax=Cupriavidus plantarum TaxID=942865 RepID=UPI001B06A209|nr:porin [Cupriavidus plantarum]CAG2139271.1 Outer membrane porin protein 32 [Cupriavidus plantarum]SMR85745.1 Outer membrane protein (porin) [Cupriavidus plantarum]